MDQMNDQPASSSRSTARCHISRWKGFADFCAAIGVDAIGGLGGLTRPERELLFTALAEHYLSGGVSGRQLTPATVAAYLGTIRQLVIRDHPQIMPEEFSPALRAVRANNASAPADSVSTRLRPGEITADQMALMVATLDRDSLRGRLDAAVLTVHCALDLTGQATADLHLSDLRLKFGVGLEMRLGRPNAVSDAAREVIMPYSRDAATCPVLALQEWVRTLARHGITEGPLFRPVDRHGNIGTKAAGRRTTSGAIGASYPSKILYQTAANAGLLNTFISSKLEG